MLAIVAALGAGSARGDDEATQAKAALDAHVATARQAVAANDRDGAVAAFDAIASFYRRGGDEASAAAADFESARLLFGADRFEEAWSRLERSEGHEIASDRLAQGQHMRAAMLERRGDAAGARDAIAKVNRYVTREDWNRYLAGDAKRLGVGYGWPALDRGLLGPIVALEWAALVALVLVVYRRAVRRERGGEGGEGRRV